MEWDQIAVGIILLWAIVHSYMDFQQSKKIAQLEEKMGSSK